MIPFSPPPRTLSTAEQTSVDRWRAKLTPTAETWERSTAAYCSDSADDSPADRRKARKQQLQQARKALWKAATRAAPMGLGVVELWIVQWVIGQLLNWIMRNWLSDSSGGDSEDDEDAREND